MKVPSLFKARCQKDRRVICVLITFLILSCQSKKVKYSGLNDLVIGAQQVVLYENGEFILELGAGSLEGNYKMKNDTVFLDYFNKPENWPHKLLMTEDYFISIHSDSLQNPVKIKRFNRNER